MEELAKDNCSNDEIFDCYIKTRRNMVTYNIKWEIENFFSIPVGEELISPEFQPMPGKSTYFKVVKLDGDLSVYLCFESHADFFTQVEFSILNGEETLLFKRISHAVCNNQYHLTDSSIKNCFSDLNSPNNKKLIFKCFLKKIGMIETCLCSTEMEAQNELHVMKKLTEDFKRIVDNSEGTDVILATKDGQVAAHKIILSARSSVFKKMFQHEMNETKNNVVEIHDLELIVIKQLVSFLYSGEFSSCNCEVDRLCSLYYAADKYDISDLRRLCGDALIKKINVNNVCQILALMDRHDDKLLKFKVMKFVRLSLDDVVNTAGWNAFMNNKLSAEVLSKDVLLPDNEPQAEESPGETQSSNSIVISPGNEGEGSIGGPLAFLRNAPEFQKMRQVIQQNPQILNAVLQKIGEDNPELLLVISQNQESFIRMLNEPSSI